MPLIAFGYDYINGRIEKGTVILDTGKIKILGRQHRQIIEVENRADRTDGLTGGTVEMLIIQQGNSEYGSVNDTVETFEACLCVNKTCVNGICLDGCSIVLDDCCITLS